MSVTEEKIEITTRMNPSEWEETVYKKIMTGLDDLEHSNRMRIEAATVIRQTDALTLKNQAESTKKMKERLHDVNFWKYELEREITDMTDVIEKLRDQKKRLENALMATEIPLSIVSDNINCRSRRYGMDNVEDAVECALFEEHNVITKVQALLKRAIQQCETQLERNHHAKEQCEFNWSDKKEADEYDYSGAVLHNGHTNKQFYPGADKLPEGMSTPEEWAQKAHDDIVASEAERLATQKLLTLIASILVDTSRDMRSAANNVEQELQKNVDRLEDAKYRMENQLRKVCDEISQAEKTIADIKAAIKRKDDPLKVAQTRLHNRSFRPNLDLCNDPPQTKITEEINDIRVSIEALIEQLNQAEVALAQLMERRMSLEKDIEMKKNSIFIDKVKCIPLRSRYPTTVKLQGYNN